MISMANSRNEHGDVIAVDIENLFNPRGGRVFFATDERPTDDAVENVRFIITSALFNICLVFD